MSPELSFGCFFTWSGRTSWVIEKLVYNFGTKSIPINFFTLHLRQDPVFFIWRSINCKLVAEFLSVDKCYLVFFKEKGLVGYNSKIDDNWVLLFNVVTDRLCD